MSIFNRRERLIKPISPGDRRFVMAYWMVKGLPQKQYETLKECMDKIHDAVAGLDKIKTPDEKISDAEEFLETEVK